MDIVGALQRTVSLFLSVVEPLLKNDVLAGLLIVIVLLVLLGRDTK